ncbi:MAG: hypothetical protein KGJ39_02690 [Acidobacteriota bacterium]|nr:hypothetical protein [Acidobacteriota bacterium]
MSVYPELVTGRGDVPDVGAWRVRAGTTRRGGASCNLADREIEVPLEASEVARVVRAHELMHARVSPAALDCSALSDVDPRALECAEEFRVNTLVGRVGFDLGLLCDGSEKFGATQLAADGDWEQAVCFLLAVLGTGGERDYLAGIRRSRPEWMAGLRAVRKRALAVVAGLSNANLGATDLDESGAPAGYARVTVPLARVLSQAMSARPPVGADGLRAFRRSLEPGGRRAPTGRFAELVVAPSDLVVRSRVGGARVRRPSTTGTVLANPQRLLTDPHRRAFVRRARALGGVVVVDQSGSMDIDAEALGALVRRSPRCVVVGYSHRPGDLGMTANAWVLATAGAVAARIPAGNVGNGVDGPVLSWALSLARRGEPVVWVSDGQVTDSHDHPNGDLAGECAELVSSAGIRLVRDLADAPRALRAVRWRNDYARFGRVGKAHLIRTGK